MTCLHFITNMNLKTRGISKYNINELLLFITDNHFEAPIQGEIGTIIKVNSINKLQKKNVTGIQKETCWNVV